MWLLVKEEHIRNAAIVNCLNRYGGEVHSVKSVKGVAAMLHEPLTGQSADRLPGTVRDESDSHTP